MSKDNSIDITSEVQQVAKTTWWIFLIQGIIMLVLGLMLFGQPGKTLVVMITILGTFWLISGLLDIVAGVTGHTDYSKGWIIFGGIITAVLILHTHTINIYAMNSCT